MNDFIKDCTGVILAGGENTRMPVRKAFIRVNGKPIIERNLTAIKGLFSETFIVTNEPEHYAHLNISLFGDVYNIRGPMTGIFTSLINASNRWVFVSACDMPFLNTDLIRYMSSIRNNYDAVIPGTGKNAEPLFAFYSKQLITAMEKRVLTGKRGMKDFLKNKKVKYVPAREIRKHDPDARSFINLNTPEDVDYHLKL